MTKKVAGLLLCLLVFAACSSNEVYDVPLPAFYESAVEEPTTYETSHLETSPTEVPETETAVIAIIADFPEAVYSGFVDERFELISLIFRLAGRPEHSNAFTPYQQKLNDRFSAFNRHDAVTHARVWNFGFDAVLQFAVHMERTENGFVIADTHDFLMNDSFNRWNEARAKTFIALVNDFYLATDFAAFFRENIPYFLEHSERFGTQLYDNLNKDWFYSHGINPGVMRAVISPASSQNGYASWIYNADGYVIALYGALPGAYDYSGWMSFLVHEFVHGFANNIAAQWYEENEVFRQMSNSSIDLVRMPFYPTGIIMAGEYVTRAYTILYMAENAGLEPIFLLLNEKAQGFPNIAYVYAMITGEHLLPPDIDMIGFILGMDYAIGEDEFSFTLPAGVIRWHFIDLLGATIDITQFSPSSVGNIFGTALGDVLYIVTGDGSRYLYIDLGDAGAAWSDQHRSYAIFPLINER